VFSTATATPEIVVPAPASEDAVPVIDPVQLVDQYLALFIGKEIVTVGGERLYVKVTSVEVPEFPTLSVALATTL
jgi:hypothetical protein